jgi:hypothetical protein
VQALEIRMIAMVTSKKNFHLCSAPGLETSREHQKGCVEPERSSHGRGRQRKFGHDQRLIFPACTSDGEPIFSAEYVDLEPNQLICASRIFKNCHLHFCANSTQTIR